MSALPIDASVYATCRIKRRRATKAEMEARLAAIAQVVAQFQPCSVRQGSMHLNANLPAAYSGVPAAQVVEVGLEVEI